MTTVYFRKRFLPSHLLQIVILPDIKAPPQFLRPHKRKHNHINIDTSHENANHQAILVPLRLPLGRQREPFTDRTLNGGAGRRDEVAELVGRADDEGAEGAGGEFHEMDGDDAPGALDAELFEEGRGADGGGAGEGVRIEEDTADDRDDDDGEAAAEDLGG